jgi:hypothetical protein
VAAAAMAMTMTMTMAAPTTSMMTRPAVSVEAPPIGHNNVRVARAHKNSIFAVSPSCRGYT